MRGNIARGTMDAPENGPRVDLDAPTRFQPSRGKKERERERERESSCRISFLETCFYSVHVPCNPVVAFLFYSALEATAPCGL
jgi:hypothetical protein